MKRILVAFIAVAVVALAGCGGTSSSGTAPAPSSGAQKLTKVKIATVSPLSANAVALGEAIKFGAQTALADKKDALNKAGYDVEIVAKDDQGKGEVGAQIALDLLSDKDVLGIVGTLNTSVAKSILPKIKDEHLVMVSPANTGVELTEQGYDNYNRVCFRDDYQGPAGARYAIKSLGAKTVWVIDDKTAYGEGLANEFAKEFSKQGGKVLGTDHTTDTQTDFQAVLTNIAPANPDLIYYGGIYNAGANLLKQARDKGIKAKFMSGDGFDEPATLTKLAGTAAEGTYYTNFDADMTTPDGKKFIDAYKKISGGKEPPSYGAAAYDSMGVILNALIDYGTKNAGKAPTRPDLARLVRATKAYKGLGGEITFDAKGDNPTSKVFVFQLVGGKDTNLGAAPQT